MLRAYLFDRTQEFLELATVFQSFGLSYRLHRTKAQTPLDIETLYQLPQLGEQASEIAVLPLSERLVETARHYRAHKRWSG